MIWYLKRAKNQTQSQADIRKNKFLSLSSRKHLDSYIDRVKYALYTVFPSNL